MNVQILAPQPLGKFGVQNQSKQELTVPKPMHLVLEWSWIFTWIRFKNSEASRVFPIKGQPPPKNVSKGSGPHGRSLLRSSH